MIVCIYMCIYVYMHAYIYIYIYTYNGAPGPGARGRNLDHKCGARGPGPPLGGLKSPRGALRQQSRRPQTVPRHPQDALQGPPAAHNAS